MVKQIVLTNSIRHDSILFTSSGLTASDRQALTATQALRGCSCLLRVPSFHKVLQYQRIETTARRMRFKLRLCSTSGSAAVSHDSLSSDSPYIVSWPNCGVGSIVGTLIPFDYNDLKRHIIWIGEWSMSQSKASPLGRWSLNRRLVLIHTAFG